MNINDLEGDFLLDTGFNSQLMLPNSIIEELELKRVATADYFTADGDTVNSDVYLAELNWFGKPEKVFVIETIADFSLIGMGLLQQCRVVLERRENILEVEK